jgi:hypothetical protein
MSLVQRLRLAIAVAALLLGASPALAFDVDGYRAGMPMAEVQRRVVEMGWRWEPSGTGGYRSARAVSPGPSGSEIINVFGFCRGQLVAYNTGVGEHFSDFLRLVEKETARLGTARYEANTDETPHGPFRVLSFIWREQTWETGLSMMHFDKEQTIHRWWRVPYDTCS